MPTNKNNNIVTKIKVIEPEEHSKFKKRCVGCLVLTHDNKLLLQLRDIDCLSFPGYISTFGGHIEEGETPMIALVRELNEELGAVVDPQDVIEFGAIAEFDTKYTKLVYLYFWHDKYNSITGCYEGTAVVFENVTDILMHPTVLDDVIWLISECSNKKLI